MEDIKIKNSKIHGKGMFANRDFKKGEIVNKHCFKYITKEEYDKLPDKEKAFVGKDKERYLLFLPPSRYVNHSCQPNTFVKDGADVALRDIKKGEEITTYYEDDDPEFEMACTCGNKDCKKIIRNN